MFQVTVVYFDAELAAEALAGGLSPSMVPACSRVEFTREYACKMDAEYAAKELRRDFPGSVVTIQEQVW